MRRLVVMVCLGVLAGLGAGVRAGAPPQEPNPSPQPIRPGEWPTFRTGTRLATIDAVVVDGQGRQVTDLTAADFEVVERGRKQPVRQAPYFRTRTADASAAGGPTGAATVPDALLPAASTTSPLARARPLATGGAATPGGRVIAIVVDDLGLSFESTAYVRRTLTRYVDRHVEPGDLVAIIRTAGGVGTLQQFTTDRRLLDAAIDRVRWSVHSRQGVGAFKPVEPQKLSLFDNKPKSRFPRPGEMPDSTLNDDGSFRADELKFRNELTSAGTLGALEYVVRGVEALPGRKSVVFVSEGFDLGIGDHKASRVWSAFTRVMDRANRAGVVVYSLDARGLQTTALTAEDDPQIRKAGGGGPIPAPGTQGPPRGNPDGADGDFRKLVVNGAYDRNRGLLDSQDALVYLAEQTGGFAVLNTNDLASGLTRIADDTRGYYLLGFETLIPTTDEWDPNDVKVRVKRAGLHVRARRGLFGPADPATRREPAQADPLVAAALSPFATSEIDVRLTTLFAHDRKAGSFVRSLFYIDPAVITFVDGPDGRKDADLTLLLLAIGDNGRSAGQARRQLQLRLSAAEYQEMRQRGLLYTARLPMKDTGGFQVRAAVQDTRSKKIGTSTQYVEVPKVGKGQLALSGVVMMDVAAAGAGAGEATPAIATGSLDEGVLGEPAVKIFKPGAEVAYTCEIYDGRGGGSEGVSTTATLLRDGQPIFTSPPAPVTAAPGERAAVPVGGRLSLGRQLAPGSYTLQVSVAPADAPARRRASQFAEFEVR